MIYSFSCIALDFYVGVTITMNESRSYNVYSTLPPAILKVDVVCDVVMTSTSNVLMTELRDLLYNHILITRVGIRF